MNDPAAKLPSTDAGADAFEPLRREFAAWQEAGRPCLLWWRDDDLIDDSPPLRRLADFAVRHQMPALMSVIPGHAADSLANDTHGLAGLSFCQHGWEHRNHEPAGSPSSEFGFARSLDAVAEDLQRGRKRILALFGERAVPVFVPPWNRFRADALALLPPLGLRGISQYRGQMRVEAAGLRAVDSHIDILQWNGRSPTRCKPAEVLVETLVSLLSGARAASQPQPLGILSHHGPMGDDAWAFMQQLADVCSEFSTVRWLSAAELFPPLTAP